MCIERLYEKLTRSFSRNQQAKDNKLTLEDMAGGSFTMCVHRVWDSNSTLLIGFIDSSNGGVFGSLYGTPIINLPQSAVLGA